MYKQKHLYLFTLKLAKKGNEKQLKKAIKCKRNIINVFVYTIKIKGVN